MVGCGMGLGRGAGMALRPIPQVADEAAGAPSFDDAIEAPPWVRFLDDPSANIGGGTAADALAALGHWSDAPQAPVLIGDELDVGIPRASPMPPAPPLALAEDPGERVAQAPAPVPGKGTHGSQTAKLDDIANNDPALDIDWIDDKGLDARVRESIDADYADRPANAKVRAKIKRDAGLKALDTEHQAALDRARDAAAQRLGIAKGKKGYSKADLEKLANDRVLIDEQAAQQRERAAAAAKIRSDHDAAVAAGRRNQSVAHPTDATIPRQTGKNLSRTNFMSWAMYLMGDSEKVKKHFKGIQGVKGDPRMLLAEKARLRYEAARAQFEKENPGHVTDVRGRALDARSSRGP